MRLPYKVPSSWNELVDQRGSVRIEKSRKKYVDCLAYKNIVWPLSSYENQVNAIVKLFQRKKVQGEKVKVAYKTVMIGIITYPNFAQEFKGKNSSRARKENIKNKTNIYIQEKI